MTILLVAGATGLVGATVVQQALADPRVSEVIALTRRPIPSRDKLRNIVADFSNLPANADWWVVDAVISALGTTRATTKSSADYRRIDYEYPLTIARIARAHGATRFALVSSLGADPHSRFEYTRLKGELESALQQLGYLSLTIVRPSVLVGDRAESRTTERLAQIGTRLLGPLLPRRLRVSPASMVAASLLKSALEGPAGVHILTNDDMM